MSNVSKSALTQLAAIIPYGAHNYIAKEMGYSSHFVLKKPFNWQDKNKY